MIDKREIKRAGLKFGKYLDPLGLFLLIAVFILPALAVLNLSPKAKQTYNVLGAKSDKEISVIMVGGLHDYVRNERIEFPSSGSFKYSAKLLKHDIGEYSKPILQLSNTYERDQTVSVVGGTSNPTGSPIYLLFRDKAYLIQDEAGIQNVVSIRIPKQSRESMYLQFNTLTPVLFDEEFEITVTQ